MKIDAAKWNEIVQVVQSGILKWHARAAEHGLKDQFPSDKPRGEGEAA
jgi:hypothetical protein